MDLSHPLRLVGTGRSFESQDVSSIAAITAPDHHGIGVGEGSIDSGGGARGRLVLAGANEIHHHSQVVKGNWIRPCLGGSRTRREGSGRSRPRHSNRDCRRKPTIGVGRQRSIRIRVISSEELDN